nr:hypothetical protein [Candidatus Sigynarchaeota archaeon]
MNQFTLYFIFIAIICGLFVMTCVMAGILKNHRSSRIVKKQGKRIALISLFFLLIPVTTYFMLSVRLETTTVLIMRGFEDTALDAEAQARTEAFDYDAIAGILPEDRSMFPPYSYQDRLMYAPLGYSSDWGYQPATIYYNASIEHPNTTVNMNTITNARFPWHLLPFIMHVLENGTWQSYPNGTNVSLPITWISEIYYVLSNRSYRMGDNLLVGLNATRDVVIFSRMVTLITVPADVPLWTPYLMIGVTLIVFLFWFWYEMNCALIPFRKSPRQVNASTMMEYANCRAILNVIREHPGITFTRLGEQIVRLTFVSLRALGILQRFGAVRAREINHKTAFFEKEADEIHDATRFFENDPGFSEVLEAVRNAPGINLMALQKQLRSNMLLSA